MWLRRGKNAHGNQKDESGFGQIDKIQIGEGCRYLSCRHCSAALTADSRMTFLRDVHKARWLCSDDLMVGDKQWGGGGQGGGSSVLNNEKKNKVI